MAIELEQTYGLDEIGHKAVSCSLLCYVLLADNTFEGDTRLSINQCS